MAGEWIREVTMRRRTIALTVAAVCAAGAFSGYALARGGGEPTAATITMREFRFGNVQRNYEPGRYTFTFRNNGEFPHNFTIVYVAQGRKFRSGDIDGGASKTITVNLRPGSYLAVCTVFNGYHLSQGMLRRFTVGEIDLATGQWG
jgi:plastocyanin